MAEHNHKLRETAIIAAKAMLWIAMIAFLIAYGTFIKNQLQDFFGQSTELQKVIPAILNVAFLAVGTKVFLIVSRLILSRYFESRGKASEAKVLLALYSYAVWAIATVIFLSMFFKDLGALLTSLGLIGFGITLALQKPILNFVGWLNIILTNPFSVGDRIEVNGIRGDVVSIHVMYTRVQGTMVDSHTKIEKIITIPNEIILTSPSANYSKIGNIFTDSVVVQITYESNWRKAIQFLEKAAEEGSKKFLPKDATMAKTGRRTWQEAIALLQEASTKLRKGFLKEGMKEKIESMKESEIQPAEIQKPKATMALGASSIDLEVVYQTDLRSQRATENEIIRAFLEEVEKHGDIELAYPHMQIVYDDRPKAGKNSRLAKWIEKKES
ncbi:Mechanosensitive ion channel [uncultured archaeon]|nr:Mechanosensitive ion channel [uncultured archaeon]